MAKDTVFQPDAAVSTSFLSYGLLQTAAAGLTGTKKYSVFSGSFVCGNDMSMDYVTIKIYVDNQLVFERTKVTRSTSAMDFSINVKNASTIKIVVSQGRSYEYGYAHIALVNAELTK